MDEKLKELLRNPIFKYFNEISKIPRGSGNEKGISDYLVNFAKSHNLEYIQDEAWNVIIKKPATKGYENAPTVIVQGHMDMVCDKNKDKVHDFTKDSIELRVEGDMIYACDTTLGADNGIAIAYGLTLLESDYYPHPALEVVMTVDEEVGLAGAEKLDASNLKGRILINLDSEEEGKLLVSCAGGVRTKTELPIEWVDYGKDKSAYTILISGLLGGHSGGDIDKGRGNSNKLMGRFLNDLNRRLEFELCDISGGMKTNAIPREAEATLIIKPEEYDKLENAAAEWQGIFRNELKASDSGITISVRPCEKKFERVFSKDTTGKVIEELLIVPSGVNTMSREIEGLTESSSNLGIVSTNENCVVFEAALRSCIRSLKYYILEHYRTAAELIGASFNTYAEYPEWQYDPDSKIRKLCEKIYREKYGKDAEIYATHGGVECGLFSEKLPGIDMVSFGPDTFDVHTPNEHVSISSTLRVWEYLLDILKAIK